MKALGKGSIASIVRIGLTVAWIALWVAAGCLVVAALAYGTFLALVSAGVIGPDIFPDGEGHLRIDGQDVGYADLANVTWPVLVPVLMIGGVAVGGALMIVWRLRRLFDSFCSGEPFRRENAHHLRAIWIIMLGVELARYALLAMTGVMLAASGSPLADSAEFEVRVDLSTWGAILILIVLAEVFREGARLKEEQELTI
jgi:hypothetical protein